MHTYSHPLCTLVGRLYLQAFRYVAAKGTGSMNFSKNTRHFIVIGFVLSSLCLMPHSAAGADITLTNFFSGNVTLNGDISHFFSNSAPFGQLPGVCVGNDMAPNLVDINNSLQNLPGAPLGVIPPNSDGLGESPSAGGFSPIKGACKDGLFHPSGFNQRRIMSAYNPMNGGTIFIGIDLPGGSDINGNASFNNSIYSRTVGRVIARDQVRPFDSDGNGEPDFIGRSNGIPVSACASLLDASGIIRSGSTNDIWFCTPDSQSAGAIDNPRRADDPGAPIGAEEFYNVLVTFGTNSMVSARPQIRAIFMIQNDTASGVADLFLSCANVATPFSAFVSGTNGGGLAGGVCPLSSLPVRVASGVPV